MKPNFSIRIPENIETGQLIREELDLFLTRLGYENYSFTEKEPGEENALIVRVDGSLEGGRDHFRIRSCSTGQGEHIYAEGKSAQAALYAVYELLEYLGIRFYPDGEMLPETEEEKILFEEEICMEKEPAFGVRGFLPFHDFPEGPDWWEKENYRLALLSLLRMKGNFIGFHTYPEQTREPEKMTSEPLVWIGTENETDEEGNVTKSYPSQHFRTQGDSWGYRSVRTSDYPFGLGALYPEEDMAVSYMKGVPEAPYQKQLQANSRGGKDPQEEQDAYLAVFNRSGDFLSEVFREARMLGIETCVGTETPLSVPAAVRGEESTDPEKQTQERVCFYEGIFARIRKKYPMDYYWLWTPEDWTWMGNTPEDTERTVWDVECAEQARKNQRAPFQLAMCGWTLGPQEDRGAFDQRFPKEMPFSCINRHLGFDPVEPSFRRIQGRSLWAMPWLEDDPALPLPQMWVGRIRKDAMDARHYGCSGLIGIHWRTDATVMNLRAMMEASWENRDYAEDGRNRRENAEEDAAGNTGNGGVETYHPEEVTNGRIVTADDFYADFARHYFGSRDPEMESLLAEMDCRLPRPCGWIDGPGNVTANEETEDEREKEYCFATRFSEIADAIIKNKEQKTKKEAVSAQKENQCSRKETRLQEWQHRFAYMKAVSELGTMEARLQKMEQEEPEAASGERQKELEAFAEDFTQAAENVLWELLFFLSSTGDLGTLTNLVQRTLLPMRERFQTIAEKAGVPSLEWQEIRNLPERIVDLSSCGFLEKDGVWKIRVLVIGGAETTGLVWHAIHEKTEHSVPLRKRGGWVFEGECHADEFGGSFLYRIFAEKRSEGGNGLQEMKTAEKSILML